MNRSQLNRPALLHALPVTALVLALIFNWFAVADRYWIFLYFHDMGALVPDTSPFSVATSGRYWMAGLVACGAVMVLYTLTNGLLGLFITGYQLPAWGRVWGWCAVPLALGIPLITMTVNAPTLPLWNATQVTFVTLIGLALALLPAKLAAEHPGQLIGLAFDGAALALVLYFPARLGDAGYWWFNGNIWLVWVLVAGTAVGVGGLLLITALRFRWQSSIPGTKSLFIAGLSIAYLLLPLTHFLFVGLIEGHFYITTASNFFAGTVLFQLLAWLVALLVAWAISRLRKILRETAGGSR